MTVQLAFDLGAPRTEAPQGSNGHVMTTAEAGLRRERSPGAERLLAALVKRGLLHEHLHAAASLVLALEEAATDS